MRALVDVVREGDFPELRGFSLWKLTTKPYHQDVEPFAIVLPGVAQPLEGQDADRVLLQAATELSGWIDRAAE
jgi:hypothetical protein